MEKNKKLRASYSLLSAYERGDVDTCVKMYLHQPTATNKGQRDGTDYHKKWEAEINKNKKLKIGNTEFKFKEPVCELKKYVPYNEYFDLSVVFDCIDSNILYEWKTGTSTNSMEYATKEQIPMYFLACELMAKPIKYALVVHYNQLLGESDITVVHNSLFKRNLAKNYIDTFAPEIYLAFEKKGIL